MLHAIRTVLFFLAAPLALSACASPLSPATQPPWDIKQIVAPAQNAVVTVITYDLDDRMSTIGSGFFVSKTGILVTNHHVVSGAYRAEIKTRNGSRYPITEVLAQNPLVDLIKVRVAIPANQVTALPLADQDPLIADRVIVIGSPLGLEQTVSEGIISAVREIPTAGKVFQLTAPISQGSSGGPALNYQGEAIGIVSFQLAKGQNLNFAISVQSLRLLPDEAQPPSLTEWTIRHSAQGPILATAMCRKGARLTVQGEYEEALTYFQKAAEANPEDPVAWYGLGSCYVGLDQPDQATEAFRRPVTANPESAEAHFILAMYYKAGSQYQNAIAPLLEVIRIEPTHSQALLELAQIYGELGRAQEEIDALHKSLALSPDHIPALIGMGVVLGKLGRFNEALEYLQRARTLEPDSALIHYNIGVTYHRMNDTKEETRAYILAIRANPRMAAAHYNLGLAFLSQGQRPLALGQYEILKTLKPDIADRLFEKIYPQGSESERKP